MNLLFFINNLRHVEKLNKTNSKYIKYNNDFVEYINTQNAIKELFTNLCCKSSCVIYIFENFLTNMEITFLIDKINKYILVNFFDINSIVNYIINLVSNKNIRYCFLDSMKGNCLFKDTIFKRILNGEFTKISKSNTQNEIIIESLFMKIFATKKGTNMFIDLITLHNPYQNENETNNFLFERDTFYKNLILVLIEVFSKKYSYFIKTIHEDAHRFNVFKFLVTLISKNYVNLINEVRYISETLHHEDVFNERKIRQKNINRILSTYEYYILVENFYSLTVLWLNNIVENKTKSIVENKTKSIVIDNNELIEILLHGIYYHYIYNFNLNNPNKYTFTLIEKILKKELTTNFSLIVDYIYLLKDYIVCKKDNYKYFDLYLGKLVVLIFDIYSYIYDFIKENQHEMFNFTVRICIICQNTIFKANNFRTILKQKLIKNKNSIKKFTLNVIEITNQCLEYLETYIFNNINNINKYTIGNIYYDYFLTLISTVKSLCIYYPDIIFSNELKSVFKNFIEVMLVKNHNIIITNVIVKYDEIEVNNILKNIILHVSNYKTLLNDTDLKNLKQKLLYSGKISVNEIKGINKIINYNDIEKVNKKQLVHPDKFCDPITNALIEIPIMLPNNVIVDKCMIYRYLLNNKNNPFDRQYLNKEILDNYNKTSPVLEKINNFNNELKIYKNKNFID